MNFSLVPASLTILEQTQLDEFVHSTDLARSRYDAERPEFVEETMAIVGNSDRMAKIYKSKYEIQESASRVLRRPAWTTSMTGPQVRDAEDRAFLEWRRNLADLEENEGVVLSPFERNVDFWRQLWRTVERSDIIVQIVDARDPLFFLSTDLFKYVGEVAELQGKKKNCVLLVNKADFVSDALRREWEQYFDTHHSFPVVQFSALREIGISDDHEASGPVLGSHSSGSDIVDADTFMDLLANRYNPTPGTKITVGMVGFPNVGKSSVINALLGSKKVSASSTPGKTKHIQTIELGDDLTLCDCPGIVLPSVVASKAHLVVNATMPLDHLRGGVLPAVDLVVERMGFDALIQFYKCRPALLPQFLKLGSDARALLSALAVSRKYFLSLNVPDESKAARFVLKDVCNGRLVHVMHPPGSGLGADLDLIEEGDESEEAANEFGGRKNGEEDLFVGEEAWLMGESQQAPEVLEDDIAEFLMSRDDSYAQPRRLEEAMAKQPTKRALRMGAKQRTRAESKFVQTPAEKERTELTTRISMLKPGGRGKVSKALADPYGCHAQNEL